ncbi:SDR family NAD(P)-dependent oxidoreductase [Streptomyces coelicoflavus]|uniref:SDR family NAD(P)-dependent oxidoreductase n=1 Tax=Streptomyces coelicoflavus TaxID=285562 RepID=UPI0036520FC2
MTNSADITAAIAHIQQQHQRLAVVINDAGVAPVQPLEDLDMAEFDHVCAVNVRGLVDVRQAVSRRSEGGRGTPHLGSHSQPTSPLRRAHS